MKFSQISASFLAFTALSAAGPLRRGEGGVLVHRKFENTTASATASDSGVEIIPIPDSTIVSFETEKSTTIAITSRVAITSTSSTSQASSSSSTISTSSISSTVLTTKKSPSSSSSTSTSSSPSISLSGTTAITTGLSSVTSLQSTTTSDSTTSTPLVSNPVSQGSTVGVTSSLSTGFATSQSPQFPLIANTTARTVLPDTSSGGFTVTDSFTPAQTTSIALTAVSTPSGAGASEISTVVTIVMPTNSLTTHSDASTQETTLPSTATAFSSSPIVISSVTASSLSQIPTIISATPSTSSISVSTFDQNLAMAEGYNKLFSSLTKDSICNFGAIACINGKTATCDSTRRFELTTCGQGESCFAVPMNTTSGVYVGCFNIITADKVLGIANINTNSATISVQTSAPSPTPESQRPASTEKPPQTFNSLSVTLPTASPGVIIPETSEAPVAQPSSSPSSDESTTTVQVHQTSTMVIFVTRSSQPAPASTEPLPASQTQPTEAGSAATTDSGAGSLVTIIPINPSDMLLITVTVTATVTTTEKIRE